MAGAVATMVDGPMKSQEVSGHGKWGSTPPKRYEFPLYMERLCIRRGIYQLKRKVHIEYYYVYAGEAGQLRRAIAEIAEWANERS